MTTIAARKRKSIVTSATIGRIRRGQRGNFTVDYAEAIDAGNAPEIYITGISKIERLGPGTIRFTFYSRRDDGNLVVLHTIWDMRTWLDSGNVLMEARDLLMRIPIGDGPPRSKEAH